jgi:HEAT repeat-containing taxis protein
VLEFWSISVKRMERKRDIAGIIDVLGSGNRRARRAAANALIRVPDARSVQLLGEALSSDDPMLRRNAAIALGEVVPFVSGREEEAIGAALIGALDDPDASVRTMAAASLGRTRPPNALVPLIELLDDSQPSVRKVATVVVRGYEDPRAVEALS